MTEKTVAKRIRVYGIVQGVGFRPTVSRHASLCGVAGSVVNRGPYVEIFCQGSEKAVTDFIDLVRREPPKQSRILKLEEKTVPVRPDLSGFDIIESRKTRGEIFISPDIAVCPECERELYDPSDRRFGHPFINCTSCGPRLTILDALPYDRERTSMKIHPLCPACAAEYRDPASRRYDAQPVCCPDCGPQVYLLKGHAEEAEDKKIKDYVNQKSKTILFREELKTLSALCDLAAISRVREVIASGGIAAVKGIGGFHLCCDATSDAAVALLRERKGRPMKPLAVMARDREALGRECFLTETEEKLLTGPEKPILLLKKKAGGSLSGLVAPDNPRVGVMLPYAPLQHLIFKLTHDDGIVMPNLLVMTSGNASGAPICRDDVSALAELSSLADVILSHNREILLRADDSVMDLYKGEPYMVRRSRGYAPLPFRLSGRRGPALTAFGGELKNAVTVASGELLTLSPYIGDMSDVRTVRASTETRERFETLLEAPPQAAVCDLHPLYQSSLLAEETGLPLIRVQHHYAHILSCLAENNMTGPVIGISYDGTGYGTDGTIWGGEILTADERGFERTAHIMPFRQLGGDASAREGWRIAFDLLDEMGQKAGRTDPERKELLEELGLCGAKEAGLLKTMKDRKINSVMSTSCGRLFDAVSALVGLRLSSTFEGEASMTLQFAAEHFREEERDLTEEDLQALMSPPGSFPENGAGEKAPIVLRTDCLFEGLARERLKLLRAGEMEKISRWTDRNAGRLAFLFHKGLAKLSADACLQIREKTGLDRVALSGGCFQNTLLLELTETALKAEGFQVIRHHLVPPNDGGLSLGQALYGSYHFQK